MIVKLLTDAPKHNLALAKISAWHKAQGDTVLPVNDGLAGADITYGSWLYRQKHFADVNGGPGYDPLVTLPPEIEAMRPDYALYGHQFSLGYTWRDCPRSCSFCLVPKMPKLGKHESIWTFHDSRFTMIRLLNNNTFSDPRWRETFEEIWEAGLAVHDENGYDLRLLDEEKAEALHRTKWEGRIHFAWDDIRDERQIREGLELAQKYHLRVMVYVLTGYNSGIAEDLHRCQVIKDYGFVPYPMPYNGGNRLTREFKRFICLWAWRPYDTLAEAWKNYKR